MDQPKTNPQAENKGRGVYLKLPGITILLNGPLSIIALVILLAIIAGMIYLMITQTGPGDWASAGLWLAFILLERSGAECGGDQQFRIAHVSSDSSTPDVRRPFDSAIARAWFEATLAARVAVDSCTNWFGDPGELGLAGDLGPETPRAKLERRHHEKS